MALMAVLTLLLVEALLGFAVNLLYAKVPTSVGDFFTGSGPAMYPLALAHAAIGYLLGLAALVLTVLVARQGDRRQLSLSLLGLVAVGVAGAAGMEFVTSGGADAWSVAMLASFVAAFVLFLWLERATHPPEA